MRLPNLEFSKQFLRVFNLESKKKLVQNKAVCSQHRTADLEKESARLGKILLTYEDIISRNNLWGYFSKRKGRATEKDAVKQYTPCRCQITRSFMSANMEG